MTLVDLSRRMLAVSRELNPTCEHVQGDMRSVRLGRRFDAVFVHDAIDYMTAEKDLADAITTTLEHCGPGGLVLLAPDHATETFASSTDHGGSDAPDGGGATCSEWSWDPDPADTTIRTRYSFVLRDRDCSIDVASETHTTGLFSREVAASARRRRLRRNLDPRAPSRR